MTCFIAKNLLSELVDGVLDPVRSRELEEHLAGCPGCSRELAALRRVRAQMHGLPREKAPADFLAKVMAKAERKTFLERVSNALSVVWHLPAPAKAGVAFAASLVLVVTVWLNNRPDRDLWSLGAAPGAKTAARPPAEQKNDGKIADLESRVPSEEAAKAETGKAGGDSGAMGVAQSQTVVAAAPAPTPAAASSATLPRDDRRKDERQASPLADASAASATGKGGVVGGAGRASGGLSGGPSSANGFTFADEVAAGEKLEKKKSPAKESESAPQAPPPPPSANRIAATAASTPAGHGTAPVQPGLYATVPAGAPAASGSSAGGGAAPRAMSKPAGVENAPAPKVAAKSRSAAAPATATGAEGDVALPVLEEPAMKHAANAEPAFDAAPDASGVAMGGSGAREDAKRDADKSESTVTATSESTRGAEAAPTPAPLHARYTVDAMSGPADVLEAATSVGATPVSTNPPALAKAGAYTIVVVDVPAGKWAAFAEKLSASGTLEVLVDPPTKRTRVRIEVIRR